MHHLSQIKDVKVNCVLLDRIKKKDKKFLSDVIFKKKDI